MSSENRLVIAVIQHRDSENILGVLTEENFRVTRIASSGGFPRGIARSRC